MSKREIKFRAFHEGRMINDWLMVNEHESTRRGSTVLTASMAMQSASAVMQFTGLRDKNGVEIYEGDILGGHPHGEAWVEYDSKFGCWCCKWYSENPDWDGDDKLTMHVECSDLLCNQMQDCGDAWTVIGNIHHNPEILKP